MKNRLYAFTALAAVAVMSCTKEVPQVEKVYEDVSEPLVVSTTFSARWEPVGAPETEPETTQNLKVKSVMTSEGVMWSTGDYIAVFDGKGTHVAIADGEGAEVRFKTAGIDTAAVSYIMVHPYSAASECDYAASSVKAVLSNMQAAVKGGYDHSNTIAVAKGSDLTAEYVFRNIFSVVKVTVPSALNGKVQKIVLKANGGEAIAGEFAIDCSGDAPVAAAYEGAATYSEITLGDPVYGEDGSIVGLTPLEAGEYSICMIPGTVASGLTATAYLADEDCTLTSTSSYDFASNTIHDFGTLKQRFKGIDELPYIFSLNATAGSGNTLKYLTAVQGKYDEATHFIDNYYYEMADNGVSLHAHFCGRTSSDTRATAFWSNADGNDNIPAKSFVSEESAGENYYGECFYKLSVPHDFSLPAAFNLTFGLYTTNGGIADWKVMLSSDDENWETVGEVVLSPAQYYHYTVTAEPKNVDLSAEHVLYIKFVPTGNRKAQSPDSATTTGWGSDVQLHGGVVIWETPVYSTSKPADAVYHQAFDDLLGGADYLWGDRICSMLNYAGDVLPSDYAGMTATDVKARHGYAQIGWVNSYQKIAGFKNNPGSLTTPALGASGTLKLSFRAMNYLTAAAWREGARATLLDANDPDVDKCVVNVIGGGTINGQTSVIVEGLSHEEFKDFSLTIEGAAADTRIEFTSPADAVFSRWFIDDITVTK
ncbi:MAG: hypothetical protein IJX11_01855 [Bacteroidales bacterium]|nr:hypothetical protein [Bacteroidales bacterium]